ncbi:hypothetical protein [Demequina sediminicola]|uniref:hypothetical protein n=1 Tax=Demequina sediminicola TaxID=1095026 RepID=UPI0007816B16|nr:hypothetical protein [Demequina sediminicola]
MSTPAKRLTRTAMFAVALALVLALSYATGAFAGSNWGPVGLTAVHEGQKFKNQNYMSTAPAENTYYTTVRVAPRDFAIGANDDLGANARAYAYYSGALVKQSGWWYSVGSYSAGQWFQFGVSGASGSGQKFFGKGQVKVPNGSSLITYNTLRTEPETT